MTIHPPHRLRFDPRSDRPVPVVAPTSLQFGFSLHSVYTLLAYYLTLFFFGTFGLGLSLFSLLTGWLPPTERVQRFYQRLIHWHFALFHWWCATARLVYLYHEGFDRLPPGGCVLVANHPALIDITCLLARLPAALCVFKPAIRRNPVLGAAARRAGYLASDGGHEIMREAAAKVAAGHQLVIFPEGTRTPPGTRVLPFKPGFVLIARRARVPIQLVRIVTNSNVLGKGQAWWWPPQLPAYITVTAGPLVSTDTAAGTAEIAARIEEWFRADPPADAACTPAGDAVGSSARPVAAS